MARLTTEQTKFLIVVINERYKFSDIAIDFKRSFKILPKAIAENPDKPIYTLLDQLIEEFPDLAEYFKKCDSCEFPYEIRQFRRVRFHKEQDPFVDWEEKHVCRSCMDSNYCTWRDGHYHNVREPRISRYHGNDRAEFYKNVDFTNPKLLGMEIETYIQGDRRKVIQTAQAIEDHQTVVAEEDGSLDHNHGVEFVFVPTTLDKLTADSHFAKIIDTMKQSGVLGFESGRGYGIHISINAIHMSRLHCSKFCYFINRNIELCEYVGGRPESRFAEYQCGRLSRAGNVNENKYIAAVKRSNSRIEVRIFRSSLSWNRIRRNFEFVDSVREYTKIASSQQLNKEGYMRFLEQESCYKTYKNMRNLLGLNGKVSPSREIIMSSDF